MKLVSSVKSNTWTALTAFCLFTNTFIVQMIHTYITIYNYASRMLYEPNGSCMGPTLVSGLVDNVQFLQEMKLLQIKS